MTHNPCPTRYRLELTDVPATRAAHQESLRSELAAVKAQAEREAEGLRAELASARTQLRGLEADRVGDCVYLCHVALRWFNCLYHSCSMS